MKNLLSAMLIVLILVELAFFIYIGYLKFTTGIDQTNTRFFLNNWGLYVGTIGNLLLIGAVFASLKD